MSVQHAWLLFLGGFITYTVTSVVIDVIWRASLRPPVCTRRWMWATLAYKHRVLLSILSPIYYALLLFIALYLFARDLVGAAVMSDADIKRFEGEEDEDRKGGKP